MNRRVLQVCEAFSHRLVEKGAEAVVLFGSWARGDAYKDSDIDLHALGKGPHYGLDRYRGFLISVSWATAGQNRRAFNDPGKVGGVIPAWRGAVIIHDPKGIAKALKQEAREWRWESLGDRIDGWVAEELTGYAEEVHRLMGNLRLKRKSAASVQRSLLAIYIAPIIAVHHRILYDTENQLWDVVSARMGMKWSKTQSAALGEDTSSFEETCQASLKLYELAATEVRHLLNQKQLEVVAHACKIAGYPLTGKQEFTKKPV
jgi:hypothetical protein